MQNELEDMISYGDDVVKKIDLFKIKILGFLICRGHVLRKADILFDMVKDHENCLQSNSYYLKMVIRSLMYYSELLPKNFVQKHKEQNNEFV